MQNILLDGFSHTPSSSATVSNPQITAKLGDLGIVMEPAKGLVQPIIYRAPEVYFRNEISSAADIWSWGLIYCQLLEAQASFHKYGLYDELLQGSSQIQKERSVERAIAHDFGLGALDYYDGCRLPYHDRSHREGQHWERLKEKGVPDKEIQFLRWVLNPVPTDRPTAQEILDAGWFTTNEQETGRIAENLKVRVEESRRRNIHRKNSEPLLTSVSSRYQSSGKSTQPPPYVAASTAFPGTHVVEEHHQPVQFQPVHFEPVQFQPVTFKPVEQSRPMTPRASTHRPAAGGTFMNYSSFMN